MTRYFIDRESRTVDFFVVGSYSLAKHEPFPFYFWD